MQPIPNLATESTPAAFVFGYMHAHSGQNAIIKKYWPEGDASGLQPVGPSPVIVHVDTLRKLTPRWLEFSLGLRSNGDAERVMQGWVQEMWGYSIACGSLGIRHRLVNNFQVEHGALARHIADDFHTKAYIFHYTYGIEYRLDGNPQGTNQIGEWSLDKRHYGADHPPRNLQGPPDGANAAAYWLLNAWNEGSAGTPTWPESKSMGTIGWRRNKPSPAEVEASAVARAVSGTKWKWGGVPGFEFKPGGVLVTPWGTGTWGIVAAAGGGAGAAAAAPPAGGAEVAPEDQVKRCADCLFADFANANHNIRFDLGAAPPTFKSVRVGDFEVVRGEKDS